MTNLNSVLKSRDITLPTKVYIVKLQSSQWSTMVVRAGPQRKQNTKELMPSNCGAGEDSWESLGQQGDQTSQSKGRSTLNIHWKGSCWSSSILVIWCKQMTHWKHPWSWERLREGEEGIRGWDGWTASPLRRIWSWANSGDGDGQGDLACCSPWGHKELDTTGPLNNNYLIYPDIKYVSCGKVGCPAKVKKRATIWSSNFASAFIAEGIEISYLKGISAYPCSLKHYLQHSRYENNINALLWMNG